MGTNVYRLLFLLIGAKKNPNRGKEKPGSECSTETHESRKTTTTRTKRRALRESCIILQQFSNIGFQVQRQCKKLQKTAKNSNFVHHPKPINTAKIRLTVGHRQA
jgi:hypothetical protein